MKLHFSEKEWSLEHHGSVLLRSDAEQPLLYAGIGQETVDMYRGNFQIEDYVTERRPLLITSLLALPGGVSVEYGNTLSLRIALDGDCATLTFTQKDPSMNRLWVRVPAEPDECCWGCGEQMSYFNLRGRHFPLWTSEPGV
ncbi:MAG: alpha-glucosidase, partial [Oscillospiraceae bacterium]|nr:alpha-glucosidase [Oscillospiraceae bacterium]